MNVENPSILRFAWIWLSLGFQSFGGGTATLTLIHRAVVEQNNWLTDEEFANDWAICQITPGINLIALTYLIGKRVCGVPGIIVAAAGLLVPAATITVLITALYAQIKHTPLVQQALRGIIPATVGLGFISAFQMAKSLINSDTAHGPGNIIIGMALLVLSGLAFTIWHPEVVVVILVAGAICALYHHLVARSENGSVTE
ncbi:MAG: chromate transporter [Chthonomonadales bacterium]